MKKIIIFIFLFCSMHVTFGQQWPEVNTQWIYKLISWGETQYMSTKVVKDTLIDGEYCKILESEILVFQGFPETGEEYFDKKIPIKNNLILKNNANVIYYLYEDQWIPLYSFELEEGEDLLITGQDSFRCHDINTGIDFEIPIENVVQVNKIENTVYGGNSLDAIYLSKGSYWNYSPSDIIFKNIGPKSTFFPQPTCQNDQLFKHLSYYSLGEILVCFEDESNNNVMTDENVCLELFTLTNNKETLLSQSVKVYPNPVYDVLFYEGDLINPTIELYNINGILIKKYFEVDDYINVQDLTQGIYFGKVLQNNLNTVSTFKIIKL